MRRRDTQEKEDRNASGTKRNWNKNMINERDEKNLRITNDKKSKKR